MSIRQRLLANLGVTLSLFMICFGIMAWGTYQYDHLRTGVDLVNSQVQGWLNLNFQISQYLKGGLEAIVAGKKVKEEDIATHTAEIIHTFIGLEKTARLKQPYLSAEELVLQKQQLVTVRDQFGLTNEELEKSVLLMNQGRSGAAIGAQITAAQLDSKFISLIADALKKEKEHALKIEADLQGLKKRLMILFSTLIGMGLSLGAFLMSRINRSVQRSIQTAQREILRGTQSIGSGNLDTQIQFETHDELSVVAVAFNKMAQDLKNRSEVIERIYHNVKSAFLLVNKDLKIEEGFTDSCKTILNANVAPGIPFTKVLSLNPRDEGHFTVMLEQIFEDILPVSTSIEQLPLQHEVGPRILRLEPSVVRNEHGKVQFVLFTIHDITKLKHAERENINNTILMKILRQKDAFCRCLLDAKILLQNCKTSIRNKREREVRSMLHTLKGNVGIFELAEISNLIHITEDKPSIDVEDIFKIENAFRSFLVKNESILKIAYEIEADEIYSISKHQVEIFSKSIQNIESPTELKHQLMHWIEVLKQKSLEELFIPLVSLTQNLSLRLQKQVSIQIHDPETMVDAERLASIMRILPHIIRNAIDHGIEVPEKRGKKLKEAKIDLSVKSAGSDWVITITDDGRGIDVEALVSRALEMGVIDSQHLEKMSDQEKIDLVFKEKISTAKGLTEISGRGIGMSTVSDVVQKLNGKISVYSKSNEGTTFEIRIPSKG